jgi:maleylacetoacetate isomerase
MKLYGFWRSLASLRVRIALNLKGLAFEETAVDLLKGQQFADGYKALNPQSLLPALILDDGGPPLFQSLAILEYLDETHPQPPLMPKDARGRARVRGLALISAADGHPLVVPRIRNFLEKDLGIDEAGRNRWLQHWTLKALEAYESHLASGRETGRFCHGDQPTIADICLAGQVFGGKFFNCDLSGLPTVNRVFAECMKLEAFDRAQPLKQPGAPSQVSH